MFRLFVTVLGLSAAASQAQSTDAFLQFLDRLAQQQLNQRDGEVRAIGSRAEADRRKVAVREKLLASMGGLPTYRGPLRARVIGQLKSETHIIEKIIFESLPGLYVTGNLYRPNSAGRYPAVLVPSGHTQEGKPEPQILAANLALQGYVALTYDPIGQGEREQTYLPILGRALSGGGGNEHLELGARSILIGQSVARYFIHDAIRAIDYLVNRPDVNPDKIGVTGCSGGGAIATYTAAFDPRIKASAAGCFINTFHTQFTGPTPDSEMSFPSFLANGLDQADLFELAAPLPWLMMATTEDYFTPAGARPVYDEVRNWYRLHGAEDRVDFFIGQGPHGTPTDSREAIYRWFRRWLKDDKGDTQDRPVKLYTNRELRVTASGNVDGEPGSRKVYQVVLDEYRRTRQPLGQAALAAELKRLGIGPASAPPAVQTQGQTAGAEFAIEQLRFETEAGITIGGKLYLPKSVGRKPAVVVVEEKRLRVPLFVQPSQSTVAIAEALVRAGHVVFELDVRDSPDANDGRPFLGNWLTNERADLVGRNLAAMRAQDILRAVDVLAARPDVDPAQIRAYARGAKGVWLLLAAAADQRLQRIWLDRTPASFQNALDSPLTNNLFEALIPGFARHWDIADLARLAGPRRVFWTDPANWMNQVQPLGPAYRYRLVADPDTIFVHEFLQEAK